MSNIHYELAHVGINCMNASEALEAAKLFSDIFNLSPREGNSSFFAGSYEVGGFALHIVRKA